MDETESYTLKIKGVCVPNNLGSLHVVVQHIGDTFLLQLPENILLLDRSTGYSYTSLELKLDKFEVKL